MLYLGITPTTKHFELTLYAHLIYSLIHSYNFNTLGTINK